MKPVGMEGEGAAAEAARQMALLQALGAHQAAPPTGSQPLPGPRGTAGSSGLSAYRANAQAAAERALTAAYPVLSRLLGEESVCALARDQWRLQPPIHGDLGLFGAGVADWLPGVHALSGMPWLADVARLEWAVHLAHRAADAPEVGPDLQRLATGDPERLRVRFVPGTATLASRWPVLSIWRAHQVPITQEPDLTAARGALAAGRGEHLWVWRRRLQVELTLLDAGEQAFSADLLAGEALGPALARAMSRTPDFSFEAWLTRALRGGWLMQFEPET